MMESKFIQKFLLWSSLMFILTACGNQTGSDEKEEGVDNMEMSGAASVDHIRVAKLTEAIIHAIPSSEEVEELMNDMGKQYQMELLNPIEHVSKYQLVSDKAINLGIYLCDLGYISSFDQTQELIFYINCSKKLSEGIGVHEIVDQATLENLEIHIDNPDSLQAIIHRIYNETYAFLNETNRLSTATLLVAGGWIEGLYIAMQLIDLKNPHLELVENLIRQQAVYDQLIELLGNFKADPAAAVLHDKLIKLGPVLKNISAEGQDQQETLSKLKEEITEIRTECIIAFQR